VRKPGGFVLDQEREPRLERPRANRGVLLRAEQAVVILRGEQSRRRGPRLAEHVLQPLAGAPKGRRLLAHDLAFDATQALARTSGHSTDTDLISHCWRSRKCLIVSTTEASAETSRLMRSGRMCRTSGYVTRTLRGGRTRSSEDKSPWASGPLHSPE